MQVSFQMVRDMIASDWFHSGHEMETRTHLGVELLHLLLLCSKTNSGH